MRVWLDLPEDVAADSHVQTLINDYGMRSQVTPIGPDGALTRRRAGSSRVSIGAAASGAVALGALAIGAFAVGALAIGALAVGRVGARRVVIDRATIKSLTVQELNVGRLRTASGFPREMSTRAYRAAQAGPRGTTD